MAEGKLDSAKRAGRRGAKRPARPRLNIKGPKPATGPGPATPARPRVQGAVQRAAARRRLARRQARPFRPMPAVPTRRPATPTVAAVAIPATAAAVAGTVAAEDAQHQSRVNLIRQQYSSLESGAQLADVYRAIGHLDGRLTQFPLELAELRKRGYVHAGQLEDQIAVADEHWDTTRPQVEQALREQSARLDVELNQAGRLVMAMSAARPATINAAETVVRALQQRIHAAQSAVSGLYAQLAAEVDEIDDGLDRVDWMLDHFEESKIERRDTEAPLAAAEAQWHESGESGPDGILFLTDQRLLFEQREDVATRKILGLITTESERIQELRLAIEIEHIDKVADLEEKSGFLGMAKDEILELEMSAAAQLSRARFHLASQDSTAWASLIKRVKRREIDEDRAEDYAEEIVTAQDLALSFPTQCPYCFAPVPTPPRGVTSTTCDYCNSVLVAVPRATA